MVFFRHTTDSELSAPTHPLTRAQHPFLDAFTRPTLPTSARQKLSHLLSASKLSSFPTSVASAATTAKPWRRMASGSGLPSGILKGKSLRRGGFCEGEGGERRVVELLIETEELRL